ncbi:MAG: 16S rRNA (uracil(1498)-N(3))-methyltransferase [Clostridia bacterium]|nr:16S rRNA (uracil(1498)-N(3))-methyltransferase [Clostridia bacterium]
MPRFFVTSDAVSGGVISIKGDDAYHIARSLRMAVGDAVTVSDGEGREYFCTLSRIRDEECLCDISECAPASAESPVKITLYMAYPKGDKLETVVQKAVELGVFSIVPFESSRCVKKPKAEKADKQTERLQRIAKEAAKQSGRGIVPEVCKPVSFSEMLALASKAELPLLCYEGEKALSLKEALAGKEGVSEICAVVGCEGGFSEEEARLCREAGLVSVSLGPRILRCETAPSYILSALSFFFEL